MRFIKKVWGALRFRKDFSPAPDDTIHFKPFGCNGNTHSEIFIERLLGKLRLFPDVSALPTHTWIPKSLGRRYSKVASSVLDWWLRAANNSSSLADSEVTNLFLRVFDYLVSRDERPPQSCRLDLTELPKEDQPIVAQQIRSRL